MIELRVSGKPETTDMMAVHQVFRQALATAPALLKVTTDTDIGRTAAVASYYDNVLRFLRVHYDAEDELVWPKLLERCPTRAQLVHCMIGNHEEIRAALDHAALSLSGWSASNEPAAARQLASSLADLEGKVLPHLDDEEDKIVPVCSDCLTMDEWGEMPGYALAHYDGDKIWLIMGLIREHMSQAQRDAMLDHMPPPAREMWTNLGEAAFEGFMTNLREPLAG